MNDMSDLSFTQTSRAMSSTPLNRARGGQRQIWHVAAENNKKPLTVVDRVNGVKVKSVTGFRK